MSKFDELVIDRKITLAVAGDIIHFTIAVLLPHGYVFQINGGCHS